MRILRTQLFTAALAAAALLSNPASAAIYMAFGGIQGDVTEPGYENRIELDSFQWGQGRAITFEGGGTPSPGDLSVTEVTVTKTAEVASSSGFAAAILSNKKEDVIISIVTPISSGVEETVRLELCGVLVSSLSTSSGGDVPSESISLNFEAYRLTYFDSNGKIGGAGAPVQWDLTTNSAGSCAVTPF